ncbi:single-stranded DNA-binding protein [Corynebacterium sp.]|uniref:single-stranded DNA-binding protein n=1 Tax=Corynebacterium sp. TaxID=1720 RepID=UPI0026E04BB4|nr:single-stranded DNA-binding protein [Corynebacterium sp.]MDO5513377.1 single-stranded DNA-binding protein [Corynebacterium sp.]
MAQTTTTILGNLTDEPSLQYFEKSTSYKARLRIASSRRVRDKKNPDLWIDSDPLFIDVEIWGPLAINCKKSLGKGMPVIAHGTLVTDEWEDKESQQKRQVVKLRCFSIGLDLNRYVIGSQRVDAAEKNLLGAALPADVDPKSLCEKVWEKTEPALEPGPEPVGVVNGASASAGNGVVPF